MKVVPFNKDTFKENPFTMLGDDWMLVTAGKKEDFNTLTVAWGGLGFLWKKPVFYAVVRHSRHTFGYMENINDLPARLSGRTTVKPLRSAAPSPGGIRTKLPKRG